MKESYFRLGVQMMSTLAPALALSRSLSGARR
jgi:hypothetical protein